MTRATDNKPLKRVFALLKLLNNEMEKHPDQDVLDFNFDEIQTLSPLFSNVDIFEDTCNKVESATDGAVVAKRRKAGKEANQLPLGTHHATYTYFSFFIHDRAALLSHLQKTQKEIDGSEYVFVLNGYNLYKQDNPALVYPMQEGLRHNLLKHLAKEKTPIETQELARNFNTDTHTIRKTIGEIREKVGKKLAVPANTIIKHAEEGYYAPNVILE